VKFSGKWKVMTVLVSDIVLTICSYWLAYLLRFNFNIPHSYYLRWLESLPVLLLIRILCYYFFGLYGGVWRYASMNDLVRILKAVTLGTFLFLGYGIFRYRLVDFPRSVFLIDWFVLIIFLGGSRFLYRLSREFCSAQGRGKGKRILIIGAGDAGEMLVREMRQNPGIDYDIVGFLDDNPEKLGRRIHNVTVLGRIDELESVIERESVDEAIIAIPSITGKDMRSIMHKSAHAGIPCKTLPAISDILNGRVTTSQIREVRIEDLLGREHVKLNQEQIRDYLSGKRVLVTGAGGSIGLELCRQIMKVGPEELVLYERIENELYNVEMEFLQTFPDAPYKMMLGDILDTRRFEDVLKEHKPQVVFHAAAYKHVPIMEAHPFEAVKNNILGTLNVAEMCAKHDVEKFVLISTDKAVKPANVMGATKRIAELICQAMNQTGKTRFIAVRFGNVLNSAGSVIPLFKRQIMKGGPVTVTHPDMTRFFMSIPEAAQLVMQAGAIGKGGEIFVLDMGEPVRIIDLATDMVRLMGFKVGEDIDIVYTGLRPGEKIHEELVSQEEEMESTPHEKIMLVRTTPVDRMDLRKRIDELLNNMNGFGPEDVRNALISMIPENQAIKTGP